MDNEIMVSVSCLVYNHEKYLRKCLNGFVMQKTNFKFEVLIHDDASTDHSADIIREYEKKYPEIIKPIYQTENQYSKGVSISSTYQYPRARGKYIAFCEGDDSWCNFNKLQKQFEYMESHPECTLCVHEAYKHNCATGKDLLYTEIAEECNVPIEQILTEGAMFATNSCFVRKKNHINMPDIFLAKGFGDHQLIIYNTLCGYCHYFPDIMSVYNWGTEGSWTQRVYHNNEKRVEQCKEMIALMNRINEYTHYQYNEAIQKKIAKTEFNMHLAAGDIFAIHKKKYGKFVDEAKNSGWKLDKECTANLIRKWGVLRRRFK